MGKALLLLVLSSSLVLVTQLFTTIEGENKTAKDQRGYQEDVIAREIAQSAFNVGMGEVRAFGERVLDGTVALNGANGAGRAGAHSTGRFAGGSYTVRALPTSGHSARIVATGTYGGATFTMHDEYRMPALVVRDEGLVVVPPPESTAGYCAAVFYQAYPLDMAEGEVPEVIMLFAADNKNRPATHTEQSIYVEAGTQMNFFIGVDKNCSTRLSTSTPECGVRDHVQTHVFNPSDYDYIHYALEVEAGELDQALEGPWAFVEQHPDDRQRWRIGWEDMHQWHDPASENWLQSLQATKSFGYYGTGWPTTDSRKYRLLQNFSNQPDFSDQVIDIQVYPATASNFHGKQVSTLAKQAHCDEPLDDPIVAIPADLIPEELSQAAEEQGVDLTSPFTLENSNTDLVPDAIDVSSGLTESEFADYACRCLKNNRKIPLLHRPPGNESNEQLLCLPHEGIEAHVQQHNDVFPTCEARHKVKSNNGN